MFLVSSLIINQKVTNGSIVKIDKILEYCPDFREEDITGILKCFVEEGLIKEHKHYQCKEGHDFTPKKQDYELGYSCLSCAEQDMDEEERYIDPDDLENFFSFSTYRVNKLNQDIWNARSHALNGDYSNAARFAYHALKEAEDFNSIEKKDKLDRASKMFTIGGQGSNILSRTPELLAELSKIF